MIAVADPAGRSGGHSPPTLKTSRVVAGTEDQSIFPLLSSSARSDLLLPPALLGFLISLWPVQLLLPKQLFLFLMSLTLETLRDPQHMHLSVTSPDLCPCAHSCHVWDKATTNMTDTNLSACTIYAAAT